MSNYTQTTFFTPKDTLPVTDPNKTIFGSAYDTEFGNISTAIATKYDSNTTNITLSGTLTAGTITSAGVITGATLAGTNITRAGVNIVQQGTFTGTLTGCTSSPTQTFNYTILNNKIAIIDIVTVLSGTSNAVTMTVTGLPGVLNPAGANSNLLSLTNGNNPVLGNVAVGSGVMTFGVGAGTFGNFTASSIKGLLGGTTLAVYRLA